MIALQDIFILGGNAVAAWLVSVIAVYAAVRVQDGHRRVRMWKGGFALFYSISYWWLAFNLDYRAEWSAFMVWFGLAAWGLGWASSDVVAIRSERQRTESVKKVAELAEAVVEDGS